MAIVYLMSVAALWAGMMMIRKSEGKQNFLVWLILSALLVLGFQAMFAGVLGKLGIPLTMLSVGLGNLACAAACFLAAARKGKQAYELKTLDIISVALILGIVLLFGFKKYGRNLDIIDFVSVDATAHTRSAMTVATEHMLPNNLFFTSLNTGLMMQVHQALTGAARFDLYKVFIWGEVVYTALAALLFWGLVRQRCGEGKWQRFVPLLITPFYWAGYPLYSTLFGFTYLGMSVCLFLGILTLLDLYFRDRIGKALFAAGMNLMLFGIFVSYTLFVPAAFFGVFAALGWRMVREKGKKLFCPGNILTMLEVFLIPTMLGLLFSFSNVEALGPGGGIRNEGGCYNDIYSNFILLVPFMAIGIYFLVSRKEGGYLLPMAAVQAAVMAVFLAGLMAGKVSVYYYTKLNSVFWVFAWMLTAEAILGMMRHCKWAVLFPFFFYGVVFMGKYGDAWLKKANNLAGRVQVWNFCDLIMINNTYFNFDSIMTPDTMELYRYAAERLDPEETAGVHFEVENGWFRTLTGSENYYTYVSYKDFLQDTEEKGYKYIVAGTSSGTYRSYKPYLDLQEVVMENSAGKIYRITVKPSEMEQKEGEITDSP